MRGGAHIDLGKVNPRAAKPLRQLTRDLLKFATRAKRL